MLFNITTGENTFNLKNLTKTHHGCVEKPLVCNTAKHEGNVLEMDNLLKMEAVAWLYFM